MENNFNDQNSERSNNKCFICGKVVTDKEKLINQFEIACKQHEGLAELSTKLFFEKYPNYTEW